MWLSKVICNGNAIITKVMVMIMITFPKVCNGNGNSNSYEEIAKKW